MRTQAFIRYEFDAEYWNFEKSTNPAGEVTYSYVYDRDVKVALMSDPNSPRMVFISEKPLRKQSQLRNIKDAKGRQVMPGGWYTLTTVEPILGVWNRLEGYRLRAAMANEPTFEDV